jgi:hypothetical protein
MKTKLNILMVFVLLAAAFSPSQPVLAETIPCIVTSDADSGGVTLRALLADTTCDTIGFASDMSIHLTSPLWIESGRTVTIDGTVHAVSITDDNYRRVITVANGADATLQNVTIAQGSNNKYYVASEGSISEQSMIPNFGTLKVNDSSVSGDAANPSSQVGGGIINRGTLIVNRSTFTGHSALGGGAIYNDGYMSGGLANITVTDSAFAGNESWAPSQATMYWTGVIGAGGAITNFAGTLTVTGSTFAGNTANYAGGAIVGYLGVNTITNNTFTENAAVTSGGAVMLMGGTLTNNTFSGNSASNSSALYVLNLDPMSVTISNNLMVKGATVTGTNCLLETTAGYTPGIISATNNLADDDSCGTGFTNLSSLSTQIGTLGNYGGPTQTIPLLAGSPGIDAGDDANCPATDQRGLPRVGTCDIGAYEYEPPSDYIVSGTVYEDINANGTRDAGEPGAQGARVILALNINQLPFNYLVADAAEDGSYEFTLPYIELPEGFSVSVYVEQADGIRITQTPALFVSLTGNLTGMDIGLHIIVLTPTPARFPDGVQGVPYNQTITLTDGDAPYSFTPTTSWSVPAGLSYAFDPQAGTITLSGTPTEAGTFHTHVDIKEATGAFGQIWEDFTIYPPMQFSPENLPDGSLNVPYNQTITVSGGIAPYTFRDGSEQWLPTGLTVDTSSGNIVLSGTPTEAGQVALDVYVTDQIGTQIEIQPAFWIKTDPTLMLTSFLNPSLDGQEVTFSLGSAATVAHFPAPWGQVTFYADGAVIPGCEGLWMGNDPTTEQPAPNPVTCKTSTLAVGSHSITASLTTIYGPYNSSTATLQGGQTVNANVPQYVSVGFTAPLDLGGVLNTAKAGQMIPLKWRLLDASGNPVTNLDPASVTLTVSSYSCPAGATVDAIETYTSGASTLQNLGNGDYQLNWKTDKTWVNSCKQLTLRIGAWSGDGFTALFQFRK